MIPATIPKLILMLSSSADGEVVAAARAIGRTLAGAGLSFHDLAAAIEPPRAHRRAPREPSWQAPCGPSNPDADRVAWCFRMGVDALPAKDQAFLVSIAPRLRRWGGRLTPSQKAWLDDICTKIEARAA